MIRSLYVILFLFIAFYSYADMPSHVCSSINYQSTDCRKIKDKPDIDDMRRELEYLEIEYRLKNAREGKFDQPVPIIIVHQQRPEEGVIVKTYFEEE